MKKYWHIALMLFCVLMITSCGDDDEALEVDDPLQGLEDRRE